eukprot:561685-Lingulodinium_polyedra.AAC.1
MREPGEAAMHTAYSMQELIAKMESCEVKEPSPDEEMTPEGLLETEEAPEEEVLPEMPPEVLPAGPGMPPSSILRWAQGHP